MAHSGNDVVVMPPRPAREEPTYVVRSQVKAIEAGDGETAVHLVLDGGEVLSVEPREASTRGEAMKEVANRLEYGSGHDFKNWWRAVKAVENGKMMESAVNSIDPETASDLAEVASELGGADAERFVRDLVEMAEKRSNEEV